MKYKFIEIKYNGKELYVPVNPDKVSENSVSGESIKLEPRQIINNMINIISNDNGFPLAKQYMEFLKDQIKDIGSYIKALALSEIRNREFDNAIKYLSLLPKFNEKEDIYPLKRYTELSKAYFEKDKKKELEIIKDLETSNRKDENHEITDILVENYIKNGLYLKAYLTLQKAITKEAWRDELQPIMERIETSACIEAYSTYIEAGRINEAREWLFKSLRREETEDALSCLAESYEIECDYEKALEIRKKILKKNKNPYHYQKCAEYCIKLNEADLALKFLSEGVAENGEDFNLMFNYMVLTEALEDRELYCNAVKSIKEMTLTEKQKELLNAYFEENGSAQ